MKGLAVTDGMSRFAANNAELIFCVVMKDVTTKFGAIASLMTYLFTVVADYHTGPNTIRGCVTSSLAVVAVTRCRHRFRAVKLGDVEGERSGRKSVNINWFITGSLMGLEGGR